LSIGFRYDGIAINVSEQETDWDNRRRNTAAAGRYGEHLLILSIDQVDDQVVAP
jgi:hypothetical protein